MYILVIRHAEKDRSMRTAVADIDMPLTKKGKKDAKQVGKRLKAFAGDHAEIKPDNILIASSRYLRVVQTREHALEKAGKRYKKARLILCDALNEHYKGARMGFGSGVGMTKPQLWARYPREMAERQELINRGQKMDARLPDGAESPRELLHRIEKPVRALVAEAENSNKRLLVIFTHGTVGKVLMMSLCNLPDEYFESTPSLPQGSISLIEGDLGSDFGRPKYIHGAPQDNVLDVLFIRHGQKEKYNRAKKPNHMAQLTEKGKKQAKATGKALKDFLEARGIAGKPKRLCIVHSPYRRTEQTKDIIVKQLGKKMKAVPQISSGYIGEKTKGFGFFWNKPQLRKLFPFEMMLYDQMKSDPERAADAKLPGNGESINEAKSRVTPVLTRLIEESVAKGIRVLLVVGHGGSNRAAVMGLCNLPNRWYGNGKTQLPASVMHVQSEDASGSIFRYKGYLLENA